MASALVHLNGFNRRENRRFLHEISSIQKHSRRDSLDLDFADVFGGPPRRFLASEEQSISDEKPVFGSCDVAIRRRYTGCDFYDDIFSLKPPRKSDQLPHTSVPSLSFLNPDPPISPATSNNGSDEAPRSPPARQLFVYFQKDEDLRSETLSSYRPSTLSHKRVNRENKSDETINTCHPVTLGSSNGSKSNRKYKFRRCSSSSGRIQGDDNRVEFLRQIESSVIQKSTEIELDDDVEGSAKLPKNETTSHGLDNSQRRPNKIDSESTKNASQRDSDIDMDHLFEDIFQVRELHEICSTTNDKDSDLDNKIQQWSKGKEGTIRSLLSTLQFVLWRGSGWKPVALVDIIEGNAVKRAYQRALLYLHPDKLQQKCDSPPQKYIAENVFKILQVAWDLFITFEAL